MKILASYALVGLLWCLHWLPLPVMRAFGAGLGRLLYRFAKRRRRIAEINLRLCFPDDSEAERELLVREHFVFLTQAILDRPYLWWASAARLRRMIRVVGEENLDDGSGRPIILLIPHFVGLDACGLMIGMRRQVAVIYANQTNPVFNEVLRKGRARFNDALVMSKRDGLRKVVKALRDGLPFIYASDMDFGPRDAVFVPFFGVPAATAAALPRLVAMTNARVVPLVSHLTRDGYLSEILPAWEDYPGPDPVADVRRFNAFVESQVLRMRSQYYWVHKRFKTRPPGEPSVY